MENHLIKYISNLSHYKRYSSLIRDEYLSDIPKFIYDNLKTYFNETEKQDVDWTEFKSFVLMNHPNLSDSKVKSFVGYVNQLIESGNEVENFVIKNLSTRHYADKIADKAFSVSNGTAEMSEIGDLLRQYNLEVKTTEYDLDSLNLNENQMLHDLETLRDTIKYSWSIPELEKMLGPISKGDFIILGARPDGGKTTLLSQAAVHWCTQLEDDECVLWCNNEEEGPRIRLRQIQAGLSWTREEIMLDVKKSIETFTEKFGQDKIKMLNRSIMTVHHVEEAIEMCNPKIIIIDQIWKLGGFESTSYNSIDRYAKLAQYVRDLAKKYGPIIGTSQLDQSAENTKYPSMGALYNSKTAVQGEADAILTIGRTEQDGPDIRFLHTPKNKLAYADNEWRNVGASVRIDKAKAQIISMRGEV